MSNNLSDRYPESIRIIVGLEAGYSMSDTLRALGQAGLDDITAHEDIFAITGVIPSKEWMDNITLVSEVKYVEEQPEHQLIAPIELEQRIPTE